MTILFHRHQQHQTEVQVTVHLRRSTFSASLHHQRAAPAVQVGQGSECCKSFHLTPKLLLPGCAWETTANCSFLMQPQMKPWMGPKSQKHCYSKSVPCWHSPLFSCTKAPSNQVLSWPKRSRLSIASYWKTWTNYLTNPIHSSLTTGFTDTWEIEEVTFHAYTKIKIVNASGKKKVYSMAFFVLWRPFGVSQLKVPVSHLHGLYLLTVSKILSRSRRLTAT